MKVDEYIARAEALETERRTLEWHLQEVSDYMYPRRSLFTYKNRTKGDKRNTFIYDTSAVHANTLLAAGLHGLLTNPASKWFYIRTVDGELEKDKETSEWLEVVMDIMYSFINSPQSAFSNNMHECYMEYGAFGTCVLFVGERKDLDGIYFNCRSLTECLVAENSEGFVDTVYRKFRLTVRQMVQKWGEKALSKDSAKCYERKEFDKEFDILHCVQPNSDFGKKGKKKFASVYIETSSKHMLHEGGYDENPYLVARFYKAPGETYGRSPGTEALPDVKMLNQMQKVTIKAAQKIVDPPLMMPDDGFLGPVRTTPSSINYYRAGDEGRIEPIQTGANIPVSLEMMNEIRGRINDSFFLDQFQLGVGPTMTATEVLQRTEERLRLLGPVLGRLQSEFLGPMIDRIFGILSRAKMFPPPPPQAQGAEIKVEYESPIAKSQQQLEANGIIRSLEILLPFIDRDPTVMDRYDADFLVGHVNKMFNVTPKAMKGDDEVASIKQQRAEVNQQGDEVQMFKDGALGANQAAQAMNTIQGE